MELIARLVANLLHRPSRKRCGGFSLLEILAAFVILALSLPILFRIFGNAMRASETGGAYARALMVAETQLARLGKVLPLQEGRQEGEMEGGALRWQLEVVPVTEEKTDQPGAPSTAKLFQVKIRVFLSGGAPERFVELVTYRIAPLK